MVDAPRASTHKVFLDSAEEARAFDPAEYFDCPRELLGRASNRPRRAQLEGGGGGGAPGLDAKTAAKLERCARGAGAPGPGASGPRRGSCEACPRPAHRRRSPAAPPGRRLTPSHPCHPHPPSPRARRRKQASYRELEQREARRATLDKLALRLEAGKAVMTGRGRKRKVAGATADAPAAFRWKQERKR
jgi:hypothetical protein